jgi:hypothetical protein
MGSRCLRSPVTINSARAATARNDHMIVVGVVGRHARPAGQAELSRMARPLRLEFLGALYPPPRAATGASRSLRTMPTGTRCCGWWNASWRVSTPSAAPAALCATSKPCVVGNRESPDALRNRPPTAVAGRAARGGRQVYLPYRLTLTPLMRAFSVVPAPPTLGLICAAYQ